AAQRAYLAGLQRVLQRDHMPYAPPAQGVQALDEVWEPLDALAPPAKQVLVEALVDAVSHDGQVSVAEAELPRTVCGVLHCPQAARPRSRSAVRSAIMVTGALVLPPGSSGITEASTTRRPSMPRTRSCGSTTAAASLPMRQVPAGW